MKSAVHEKHDNVICLDWLNFTSFVDSPEQVKKLLGLDHVQWVKTNPPSGLAEMYFSAYIFGNIYICFNQRPNFSKGGAPGSRKDIRRNVVVSMSGGGCRTFENFSKLGDKCWDLLFKLLVSKSDDYNITRLDVAYDDFNGVLNLHYLADQSRLWRNKEYPYRDPLLNPIISFFRKGRIIEGTGSDYGFTVLFGAQRRSNCYMRVYDKQVEKRTEYSWVRWEVSLAKENAFNFVSQYVNSDKSIGYYFSSLVYSYIKFIDPAQSDRHNGDFVFQEWYLDFIGQANEISIVSKYPFEYTLDSAERYLNQFAASLALLRAVHGEEALSHMVSDIIAKRFKDKKFPVKYEFAYSSFFESQGIPPPDPFVFTLAKENVALAAVPLPDYSQGVEF